MCILRERGQYTHNIYAYATTKNATHEEYEFAAKIFQQCNESLLQLVNNLSLLKEASKQTLVQTKKASHFEVDLETKQKRGHHLARNGIRVRQQTTFMYKHQVKQRKLLISKWTWKQNKKHLARNGTRVRQQTIYVQTKKASHFEVERKVTILPETEFV